MEACRSSTNIIRGCIWRFARLHYRLWEMWFKLLCALIGAVLVGGGFIIIGLFGSALMPRRFPPPWTIEELNDT